MDHPPILVRPARLARLARHAEVLSIPKEPWTGLPFPPHNTKTVNKKKKRSVCVCQIMYVG